MQVEIEVLARLQVRQRPPHYACVRSQVLALFPRQKYMRSRAMSSAGSGYRVRFPPVRTTFSSPLWVHLCVHPDGDVAVGTGPFETEVLVSAGGTDPGV